MRSLLSLPAISARRGLGALVIALVAATTGCQLITGVPEVKSVELGVAPNTIPVGGSAVATAVIHGKGSSIVNATKVGLGFESSNPGVAAISSTTGTIIGVAKGTAVITARSRGKSDTVTITVTDEIPARLDVPIPTLHVGDRVALTINAYGSNGQLLAPRAATVTSVNTNIVAVEGSQTTNGVFLRGVSLGSTNVTVNVGGQQISFTVAVQPPSVASVKAALQKGTNSLLETESNQVSVQLLAADGTTISNVGQQIACQSDDQTVAVVNASSCVVTGVRAGTTNITVTVAGTAAVGRFALTVQPIPAKEVRFVNRGQFLRVANDGSGVPSVRTAVAFDSAGRQITNRQISYRSTDATVFTVSSVTGTVIAQKLGTARLIASADNGAVADTLTLTVTPVPIVVVSVRPQQSQLLPNGTQQFTATLTDSLGATVSGRTTQWFSNSPTVADVSSSGLVTARAAGTATITAVVDIVPGFPGQATGTGSVLVLPTPIATIDVTPSKVDLKVGQSTLVLIVPRDANGNQLFGRNSSIFVQSDNPGVAIGLQDGTVRGLASGTASITYQALDQNGNAQGKPTTITVNVQ